MIFKEIIGLYAEADGLHILRLTKFFPWSKRVTVKEYSNLKGNGITCLSNFLQKIRYSSNPKFFLALPRDLFFVRNITMPSMPVEDAVASISNSMSIYSHLPVEDIWFDIFVNRVSKQELNVLIYYAVAKDIAPFLNVFRNTGYEKSLNGLFPLSYGVCTWLVLNGYNEKKGVWLEAADRYCELATYNNKGPLKSIIRLKDSSVISQIQMKKELLAEGASLDIEDVLTFKDIRNIKILRQLPSLSANRAVAAVAPCIAGSQNLCVDDKPTRLKLLKPWPLIFFTAIILFMISFFLYTELQKNRDTSLLANQEIKQAINELKKEIAPLSKSRTILKKAEGFREDIESFMNDRPLLNSYINEIARVVPKGTWFAHFTYAPETITMQGEATEALKVLEALRGIKMFTSVKLMGSVSRADVNTERFRVDLDIDKKVLEKQ